MKTGNVTPEDRLRHLLSLLSHLGWGLSPTTRPQELGSRRRDGLAGAAWMALALPDSQSMLVLAVPGAMPSLHDAFKRYEDLAREHRTILRALRDERLVADYLLLLGDRSAHLIDIGSEDVLLTSASDEEFGVRVLPVLDLQALVRGSLSAFPRKSLHQRARELADWTQLWATRIGGRLDLTPGVMARFFEWLHLARVAEQNQIGPRADETFGSMALENRAPAARRFLEDRFRPLHGQWFLLQDSPLKLLLDVVAQAGKDGILDECLASYALLGAGKFDAEVLAEAFADEELRHRSWRASVTDELPDTWHGDDEQAIDWLQVRWTVDLDRSGTVVLLRAFDSLVERAREAALAQRSALDRGERPGMQLDLLAGAPDEIAPQEAAWHVLKRVLTVRTTEPARVAVARQVLLARACDWHRRFQAPDERFAPVHVDVVRAPRPAAASAEYLN